MKNKAKNGDFDGQLLKKNEDLEKKITQLQIELEATKIVHQSLKEGQDFLQEVLLSEGETFVIVIDENHMINLVWCSERLEKKYGIVFQDLMGHSFKEFFSKYIKAGYSEQILEVFNNSKTLREELEAIMPSGAFWLDVTFFPIMGDDNKIWSVVVTSRDITELKEAKDKFSTVADFTVDWECWFQPEKGYVYVSPSVKKLTGYSPDDFYLDSGLMEKIIHPDDLQIWTEHLEKKSDPIEFRIISKNNEIKWIDHNCQKVIIKGKNMGIRGSQREITIRKKMEEKLKESEVILRSTLESTAEGILVVNEQGQVTHYNSKFISMWRIPQELIKEKDDHKLINYVLNQLKDPEAFQSKVEQLYQSRSEDFDILHFKDGRIFERSSNPLILGGEIHGRVWSFKDVTQNKKTEEKLKESEKKLRNFINSATDYMLIFDSELNIIEINELALNALNLKRSDAIGMSILDISPDLKKSGRYSKYMHVIKTGEPLFIEKLVVHPKYGSLSQEVKVFKVGNGLGIISRDIAG